MLGSFEKAKFVRILFVTPAFPPFVGGGEAYVGALAREIVRRGHQVTVVTSDAEAEPDFWRRRPSRASTQEEGSDPLGILRCHATGFPGGRPALMAWRKAMIVLSSLPGDWSGTLLKMACLVPRIDGLSEAVDSVKGCDLVHAFNLSWEHGLVTGWRMARQRGLPFVVTPFAHLGAGAHDRVARNHTMDHQLRILRDADAVLTLTSAESDGLMRYGLSPECVTVVGGGIALPSEASPPAAEADCLLDQLGLRRPFVLFIGRVCRDKGAIQAAKAVLALSSRGRALGLALVGRSAPDFSRYYRSLSAAERRVIRLLGTVDEMTKHLLLDTCSMLVLPSRVDSFGIVLLEAWAHRKPVVGARAGGIPSVISEGEDGLLVRYGDSTDLATKIGFVLDDQALATAMGNKGWQKVSQLHTWEAVGERVTRIYRQLSASSSSLGDRPSSTGDRQEAG